jgi:hypothetical protein
MPAETAEITRISAVALHVRLELVTPESDVRFRCIRETAASMAMPETAMHEDDRAIFRKNDIGPARQILRMQAKTVASAV